VITLQFTLEPRARRGRAGGAGGDQLGADAAAAGPPEPARVQQGEPGRYADHHARADLDDVAAPPGRDLADTRLAQKIAQLPGVGLVSISGGQRPAVRVQANPAALSAYGLTLEDLRVAVASANVNQAKGSFDGPRQSSVIGPTTSS